MMTFFYNCGVNSLMVFKTSNLLTVVHLFSGNGGKNLPKRFYIDQLKDAAGG